MTPTGSSGPGCGARGRRRGLAGLRADAPSEARGVDGERAGRPRGGRRSVGATNNKQEDRRPPAHTAAGPSGARPPGRPRGHNNTTRQAGSRCGDGGNQTPVPTQQPEIRQGPNTQQHVVSCNPRKQERRHRSHNQGKQKPQIPKDLRFHRARGGS